LYDVGDRIDYCFRKESGPFTPAKWISAVILEVDSKNETMKIRYFQMKDHFPAAVIKTLNNWNDREVVSPYESQAKGTVIRSRNYDM
jgi:hypothetical protein